MSKLQIIQNTFEPKTFKKLIKSIQDVLFDQAPQLIGPEGYLWAVGYKTVYFVQYQINSAAIFKVGNVVVLVWKPKYIEYPTMIQFDPLGDKKIQKLKITIQKDSKLTQDNTKLAIQFIEQYYGTYFYSQSDFQTKLVTHLKHYLSRISKHSYWHALMDDSPYPFLTHLKNTENFLVFLQRKEGQYFFVNIGLFSTAKNKWIQLLSFLAMVMVFYSVVSCKGDESQGLCAYKQQMTLAGAVIMFSLFGFRYSQNKKQKKRKQSKNKQV